MAPPAGSAAPPLAAATVSDLLTAAARTPGAGGLVSCALRQGLGVPAAAASAAYAAPGAAATTPAAGGSSPAPVPPTEVVAGRPLRYATLDAVASALAAALATSLSTRGERVAVLAPTGVVALAYLFAAARVAAVSVPLNTRWVRLRRVGGGGGRWGVGEGGGGRSARADAVRWRGR